MANAGDTLILRIEKDVPDKTIEEILDDILEISIERYDKYDDAKKAVHSIALDKKNHRLDKCRQFIRTRYGLEDLDEESLDLWINLQ